MLLFHARDNTNKSPWVINAIYEDVYPLGRHWYNHNEDFFFDIEFYDGKRLRVGPLGEGKMRTPSAAAPRVACWKTAAR